MDTSPTLCIVAGPNGSGKTTTTLQLLRHEWGEHSIYINPDDIAQKQFGDWNSPEAALQAAKEATRLRYECLAKRCDFVFETVFSSDEKLAFVRKAKDAGYFIRIFFVCTSNPHINLSRIAKRYIDGGHDVPVRKVIDRYYKSLLNVGKAMPLADRVYVYDNSAEGCTPLLLFRTVDGKLCKQYKDPLPRWAALLITP